jgi:hypothetical protein
VFVLAWMRCGCSLISGLHLQCFKRCVALMKSAEENLI